MTKFISIFIIPFRAKFILFLVSAVLVFYSCENKIDDVKAITKISNLPDWSSKNMVIWYSDSGMVKAKLSSPKMDNYQSRKPYIEWPIGVKVMFYDENMQVTSWLTADYAIRRETEKTMEAKRNVVVVNAKGEQVNSEHLIWDEAKEKIFSDDFVKITTADEIIYGNGFESNQDFTKYKIFQIKGTINLKDEKQNQSTEK